MKAKNSSKKIIAIIIAIVVALAVIITSLVIAFSVSGKSKDEKDEKDHKNNTKTEENIKENKEPNEVVLGISTPIDDPIATLYGKQFANGAILAINEINANGGINGMKIKLVLADDSGDAGEAYNSLKSQGMDIYLGSVLHTTSTELAPLTNADNIFHLIPYSPVDNIDSYKNCFSLGVVDSHQGRMVADYIVDNQLATNIGVIYNFDDDYSFSLYNDFSPMLQARGCNLVAAETFNSSTRDFSAQVQACKAAGAELIFLPTYYNEATLIIKAANDMNYHPQFIGCDGLDGILSYGYDNLLLENVMFATPYVLTDDNSNAKSFIDTYYSKYGEMPIFLASQGYDSVMLLAEIMRNNNIKSSMSASEICDLLSSAMFDFSFVSTVDSDIVYRWHNNHSATRNASVIKIRNGQYTKA